MALNANEWAASIAKQVGEAVAHYRAQAQGPTGGKLTAQALADRCTALGLPLDRTVIAKLEKGTRQTITVGELLILAKALEVPPVLLLMPLGRRDNVEVLPAEEAETWRALKWFTGEEDSASTAEPSSERVQNSEPLRLFREHDQLVDRWWTERRRLQYIASTREVSRPYRSEANPDAVDDQMIQLTAQTMQGIETALRGLRVRMSELGLTPPPLGPESSFIQEAPSPQAMVQEAELLASIPMEPLPPREQPKPDKGDE
jgi:transcriptional regulator with XRE-family HTH domain